ncbi:hypothetical protein Q6D67_06390 [Haliea sp. E1-2-M8]|uniref:hypothetical protein n=1 Tax=Haliea sp. E1-2-M8 TaxID=3064706 RepID=UPI002724C5B7|nr:hypothetical protein [Haliea sp. E1-2-M8]MDO8861325.1 hypothetical protein [Haliea sp. E1-2-M8]
MRIESIETLIDWTREVHFHLAKALAAGQQIQQEERARELLEYLQQQETELGKMVAGFEEQADPKALHTMVYDYEVHSPLEIDRLSDKPYGTMTYDAIAADVFASHQQIQELYRYLLGRSAIPEEQELLEALLGVEEHETMQLSQQINRGRDI